MTVTLTDVETASALVRDLNALGATCHVESDVAAR